MPDIAGEPSSRLGRGGPERQVSITMESVSQSISPVPDISSLVMGTGLRPRPALARGRWPRYWPHTRWQPTARPGATAPVARRTLGQVVRAELLLAARATVAALDSARWLPPVVWSHGPAPPQGHWRVAVTQ